MKSEKTPAMKTVVIVILTITFPHSFIAAQRAINSIVTNSITSPQVSYPNVKGAGLRNPSTGALISYWDSTGTSFNINYNAPSSANILRLQQFSVTGIASSLITQPVSATVEVRRAANADVGDARDYYNFWAQYSSIPASGATTGTFDFTAPEVTNPEAAFLSNNLASGYDNLFQNSIASPHFANIERVDFIIPVGVKAVLSNDLIESGIAVIDRGSGDPFKIAAITAIDASNTPTAFGTLVSVAASNFGGNLLASSINYGILINDSKYYSQSRPSTNSSQNLRGVYVTLADLGIAVGQKFYGYALFGADVMTADPDWTTYPTNSNNGSQLDPVNVMGLFKTVGSLLPLPIDFTAFAVGKTAKLQFTIFNEFDGDQLTIQHSNDGVHFADLKELNTYAAGLYSFTDNTPVNGTNYYRLKMKDKNGKLSYSEVRLVKVADIQASVSIFPNPVADKLNINFSSSSFQGAVTAEIFTNAGRLVKSVVFKNPGSIESISVNALQRGTYMLRLTNGKDGLLSVQPFAVL